MIDYAYIKDILEDYEDINENNYLKKIKDLDAKTRYEIISRCYYSEDIKCVLKNGKMDNELVKVLASNLGRWGVTMEEMVDIFSEDQKDIFIEKLKESDGYYLNKLRSISNSVFSKDGRGRERLDKFIDNDLQGTIKKRPFISTVILPYLTDNEADEIISTVEEDIIYDINEYLRIEELLNSSISDISKERLLQADSAFDREDDLPYEAKTIEFEKLNVEAKKLVLEKFDYNLSRRIWFKSEKITKEDFNLIVEYENCFEELYDGALNEHLSKLSDEEIEEVTQKIYEEYGINGLKIKTNLWDKVDERVKKSIVNIMPYEEFLSNSWTKKYLNDDTIERFRAEIDKDIENYEKGAESNHYVNTDLYEIATQKQRAQLLKQFDWKSYDDILKKFNTDLEKNFISQKLPNIELYYNNIDEERELLETICRNFDYDSQKEIYSKLNSNTLFELYNNHYRSSFSNHDALLDVGSERIRKNRENAKLLNKDGIYTFLSGNNDEEVKNILYDFNPSMVLLSNNLEETIKRNFPDFPNLYSDVLANAFRNSGTESRYGNYILFNLFKEGKNIDVYLNELSLKQKVTLFNMNQIDKEFNEYLKNNIINSDIIKKDIDSKIDLSIYEMLIATDDAPESHELNIKIMEKLGFVDSFNAFSNCYNVKNIEKERNYLLEKFKENINEIGKLNYESLWNMYNDASDEYKDRIEKISEDYLKDSVGDNEYIDLFNSSEKSIENKIFLIKLVSSNLYNEKNKNKLKSILQNNKYVINQLNPDIFRPEFDNYDVELIERMAKEDDMINNIVNGLATGKTQKFNSMLKSVFDGNNLEESLNVIYNLYTEVYYGENEELIDSIGDNITPSQAENLKEVLLRKSYYDDAYENDEINLKINNIEDLDNYKENYNKKCDEIFYSNNNIMSKANILANKFYSIPYSEMKRISNSYLEGSKELANKNEKYKEKVEYEFINNISEFVSFIQNEKIDIRKKNEILNDYYRELSEKRNISFSMEDILILKNKCKGEISKDLSSSLMKVKDMAPTSFDKYNDKDIPIIEMEGDFKLLIHSLGAYGEFDEGSNYKKSWNENENVKNHGLCCSLISDEYMGTANIYDTVLGFDDFEKDSLNTEAPRDIFSYNNNFVINSRRRADFHTADGLIDASRSRYNEVNLERKELRSTESKYKNMQPSCVVLFDEYSYNEDHYEEYVNRALKCAYDFDIPIVYINKDYYGEKNIDSINKKIEEFEKSKDASLLINLTKKYNNCRCGDLIRTPELKEEMDQKIEKVWEDKVKELDNKEIDQLADYVCKEEKNYDDSLTNSARIAGINKKEIWNIKKNRYYNELNLNQEEIIKSAETIKYYEEEIKDIGYIKESNTYGSKEEINKFERELAYTFIQMEYLGTSDKTRLDIYNVLKKHGLEISKNGINKRKLITKNGKRTKNGDEMYKIMSNSVDIENGVFDNLEYNAEYIDSIKMIKEKVDKSYGIEGKDDYDNQRRIEKSKN